MATSNQIKETKHKGYLVDIDGNIYSAWQHHGKNKRYLDYSKLKKLALQKLARGHLTVSLKIAGKSKTLRPQIAVAEAFLFNDNPKEKIYVCHKDGNPLNNNVNNLYWGTPGQNTDDMRKHGTMAVGNKLPQAKLNPQKIKLIRLLRKEFGWKQKKIGKFFGVGQDNISRILNNIYWKHIF